MIGQFHSMCRMRASVVTAKRPVASPNRLRRSLLHSTPSRTPRDQEDALLEDLGFLSRRLGERENKIRLLEHYIRTHLEHTRGIPLKKLLRNLSKTIIRQDPNLDMNLFLVSIDQIDISKGQGKEVLHQASFDDNNEVFKKPVWFFRAIRFFTLVLPGYLLPIRLQQAIPHFLYRKVVSAYWQDRCVAYFSPGNGNGPAPSFEFEGDIVKESLAQLKYRDGFKGCYNMVKRSLLNFRYSLSLPMLLHDLTKSVQLFFHALSRVSNFVVAFFMLNMANIYLNFCTNPQYRDSQFHFVIPLIVNQRLVALVYCVSFAKLSPQEKEGVKANPKQHVQQLGEALSNPDIPLISSTRRPNFDMQSYAKRMAEEMVDRKKAKAKQRVWILDAFFLFESFNAKTRQLVTEKILTSLFGQKTKEEGLQSFMNEFSIEASEENIFYVGLRSPKRCREALDFIFSNGTLMIQQRGPLLLLKELLFKGYIDTLATVFPGESLGMALIQRDLFDRRAPKKAQFEILTLRDANNLRGIQAIDRTVANRLSTTLRKDKPGVFMFGSILAQDVHLLDFLRRNLTPGLYLKWVDANPSQEKFRNSLSRPVDIERQIQLIEELDRSQRGLLSVETLEPFLRQITENIATLENSKGD